MQFYFTKCLCNWVMPLWDNTNVYNNVIVSSFSILVTTSVKNVFLAIEAESVSAQSTEYLGDLLTKSS